MKFPFFLLIGDSFLTQEKRKAILASLEKEWASSLPATLSRAGDLAIDSLLAEARTLPFLAAAQVFCVRDVQEFTKNEVELWANYFASPHPQTIFIFEAESLEKGHPFLEWAAKARQLFFLEPESGRIVADFIRRKLSQARKKISPEAFELLESRIGDSVLFLDTALDQLILSVGEHSEIGRLEVETLLEEELTQSEARDLVQALAEKNLPKAVGILNRLLELSNRDVPALVGFLHWQLRRFWEAKKWLAQGQSEREVSERLRLSPSRTQAFFKELNRFSLEKLEAAIKGLFDLDWKLKTGRAEGRYEIENWLVSSMG